MLGFEFKFFSYLFLDNSDASKKECLAQKTGQQPQSRTPTESYARVGTSFLPGSLIVFLAKLRKLFVEPIQEPN